MAHKLEKSLKAQDLVQIPGLEHVQGALSTEVYFVASADKPAAQSLVFVSQAEDLERALKHSAGIIVMALSLPLPQAKPQVVIFKCAQISQALADVLALVDTKHQRLEPGVASTARIHPTATVGKNVYIGEYVVVGAGAAIGNGTSLAHHVVIEKGARIGENCFLHPFVMIGADCILGSKVEIHSHSTIGSDGFGFVPQKNGAHQKIPQIGIVVLEDEVEIGANCTIDRATIDETRICRGTKFDNLVHIAHNCEVGPNSRIAAGFFLAGSSKIGANFLTGGSSVVADHITIVDNVTLGGRSAVTKDILSPGVYAGYPLEPLKDAMKSIANIAKITSLRKQVAEIRKHLGLKE
jgi:UDP-3-O-[3-hydroxymyristoyl] glucosamine N-acyltransferase